MEIPHGEPRRQLVGLARRHLAFPHHAAPVLHDVLHRAAAHDGAGAHDENLVGDVLDVGHDVRGQNDDLVLGKRSDEVAEPHALLRVEAGGGLVEHQHRRLVQHRLGNAESLLHAARERAHLLLRHVAQAHQIEQFQAAAASATSVDTFECRQVAHEVEGREVGVVAEVLRQIAQLAAVVGAEALDGTPVPQHRACRGAQHVADHAHERGLPRPVRAKQPVHAGLKRSAQPVHGDVTAELLRQPV